MRDTPYKTSSIYADTGCGGECTSSLNCPYPQCILDSPQRKAQEERAAKAQQCVRLRREGRTYAEITGLMGLSEKTARRLVRSR